MGKLQLIDSPRWALHFSFWVCWNRTAGWAANWSGTRGVLLLFFLWRPFAAERAVVSSCVQKISSRAIRDLANDVNFDEMPSQMNKLCQVDARDAVQSWAELPSCAINFGHKVNFTDFVLRKMETETIFIFFVLNFLKKIDNWHDKGRPFCFRRGKFESLDSATYANCDWRHFRKSNHVLITALMNLTFWLRPLKDLATLWRFRGAKEGKTFDELTWKFSIWSANVPSAPAAWLVMYRLKFSLHRVVQGKKKIFGFIWSEHANSLICIILIYSNSARRQIISK